MKRAHQDGEKNEGGTGKVHIKEDKVSLDGEVKKISKYSRLKNMYELLGAYDVNDPTASKNVPTEVLSGVELIAEETKVSLGYIEETDEELAAYDVEEAEIEAELERNQRQEDMPEYSPV